MEYVLQEPAGSDSVDLIPEDTVLIATLTSIAEKDGIKKDGEKFTKLNWRFRVNDADSDYDGRSIYGETTPNFTRHADCKFYAWAQMVLGVEFPPGFKIDTDLLLNQDCRVAMGVREYTKEGELHSVNFVADVLPLGKMAETAF